MGIHCDSIGGFPVVFLKSRRSGLCSRERRRNHQSSHGSRSIRRNAFLRNRSRIGEEGDCGVSICVYAGEAMQGFRSEQLWETGSEEKWLATNLKGGLVPHEYKTW